ncbi:hypothetical protein MNBD_GAMMA11-3392 [hydrothermal vent metagenome]|uniref:Transmembrane protein n=1 Tax=hydrothermal vent metagenome TaxID=652676 RepID=A0A3B0WWL1_9ZZZZ
MHKHNSSLLSTTLTLALTLWSSLAYSEISREYELKAAYLLNFARFIYWPQNAFKNDPDSFYICVYGHNPFGENMDWMSDKKINNRHVKFIYVADFKYAENCHIAYIGKSRKSQYLKVINIYSRKAVLTVSDIEGFSESGGMIGFVRVANKMKFEINVNKSTASGIKYRSQLLEVAETLR